MQSPPRITFLNVNPSPAIEARVHEHIAHIARFHPEITACAVTIDGPPSNHNRSAPYAIHIVLEIPGGDVSVRSEPVDREAHLDVYIALRDAFEAAKRLLRGLAAEQHTDKRRHHSRHVGTIKQLENGHGRIAANDGHTVYFHRSSVRDSGFDQLSIGALVEFEEELGNHGPQAAAVCLCRSESETRTSRR